MIRHLQVSLHELVKCLSDAVDLVSPVVSNHHRQVGYIAYALGEQAGFRPEECSEMYLAGSLHDIGALSFQERLEALDFEVREAHRHARVAYRLMLGFPPLSDVAEMVKHHHLHWAEREEVKFSSDRNYMGSQVLHLADRIAVLVNRDKDILEQVPSIVEKIEKQSGKMFMPELVASFKELSAKEYFWFDLVSLGHYFSLPVRMRLPQVNLDLDETLELADMFRRVIDFRSSFTATHSTGVAVTAQKLAELVGFSSRECTLMLIAGYLHDLGKLAVPPEILEKPGKLNEQEFNVIRSHVFYSYRLMGNMEDLETINTWSSLHHERLDGKGYPFHFRKEELSLGSRIMAVSDVFTALTEERPYREGMPGEKALRILQDMAAQSALDASLVDLLGNHRDRLNRARQEAQQASREDYQQLEQETG